MCSLCCAALVSLSIYRLQYIRLKCVAKSRLAHVSHFQHHIISLLLCYHFGKLQIDPVELCLSSRTWSVRDALVEADNPDSRFPRPLPQRPVGSVWSHPATLQDTKRIPVVTPTSGTWSYSFYWFKVSFWFGASLLRLSWLKLNDLYHFFFIM